MNKELIQNSKLQRQSNIELLRIISMFLVLIVHADFFSLGSPSSEMIILKPFFAFNQLLFQALSIGCVNIFVLISGWFGIRTSLKGFFKFIFQCLFFLCGIYLVMTFCGLTDLSPKGILKGIAGCFVLLKWNWFIKAYICLYMIAPMINMYVENIDRKTFVNFLICFFVFQSIYSWISNSAIFFESGYSTLSFIGLYSLARYFRLHKSIFSIMDKWYYLLIYFVVSVLLSLMAYFVIVYDKVFLLGKIYSYVNPLVIISSLSLLLFFSKVKVNSSLINWVGASCFAVFLLHTNPNLCLQYFVPTVQRIVGENYEGINLLYLLLYLVLIFVIAILLDQIRIYFWEKINEKLYKN